MSKAYLAIDLGAESGRVMLGTLDDGRIALDELHRWPSKRVRALGGERWDLLFMWSEILVGLRKAASAGHEITSISVDSWAVDYAYVSKTEPLIATPFMYRDERTGGPFEKLSAEDRDVIFKSTGVQFMPINTLYQLLADGPALPKAADSFLLIADWFHYLLTGVQKQERSNASSTQIYDPAKRDWSDAVIERFGLDRSLFPELIDAGETIGTLLPDIAQQVGLPASTPVVATCTHDTGAAVAGTPIREGAAYLSSGTWSLLGVEEAEPVINDVTAKHNFTNEVGFGHSIRLLKNLSGLFLVQECRKDFGTGMSYADLAAQAAAAPATQTLIRPEAAALSTPGDMCHKIATYCRDAGEQVPETPGEFVRCCYESLALLYAETLGKIEEVTGHRPTSINVVGGGSQATLLNQLSADACGIPVYAGPVEATALGNVGVQAIAAGDLDDLPHLRRVIGESCDLQTFQPTGDLAARADRFSKLPR